MGREAECACEWNGSLHNVKALLEPPDLILRGALRRRLPFSRLKQVRIDGDRLCFVFEGENFALVLGKPLASKWVATLTTPPPSVAKKLGISPDVVVRTIGPMDDDALREAVSAAKGKDDKNPDLILARVNTPAELEDVLRQTAKQLAGRVPIWLIYPKGRGHALSENHVRSTALGAGIVDTKVAAVSDVLTALRFVRRRDS